jgi:hypothetical protein
MLKIFSYQCLSMLGFILLPNLRTRIPSPYNTDCERMGNFQECQTPHNQDVRHNLLFSLTARTKINPSPAEGIFENFVVAEVTEAILTTEDPVAVLTAGLTLLFELFDDR